MDAIDLIAQCRSMGAVLSVEGDSLLVTTPLPLNEDLRAAIRANKHDLLILVRLSQISGCSNPITAHEAHEYPWECDPNSCLCFRDYGYPRFCQGAPCRWVWPDGYLEKDNN
jgi:hypothetical protein